jgi:hypothetical protein
MYANSAGIENNPNLNQYIFGFNEAGKDIRIPLSKAYNLFGKANSGITNNYKLSENAVTNGNFTTNSLAFSEVTTLDFFKIDVLNQDLTDYFTYLNANKADIYLKIKKLDSEAVAFFRINTVTFNIDDTITLGVSLYNTSSNGSFSLEDFYTLVSYVRSETVPNLINNSSDIKVVGNELQFEDRAKTTNSLGYKYIRSDFDFTEIPLGYDNSKLEIRDFFDYDIDPTITLPANVELFFNGGKFANCTIVGNNTKITSQNYQIFDNVTLTGTWDVVFNPSWFGIVGDGVTDDKAKVYDLLTKIPIGSKVDFTEDYLLNTVASEISTSKLNFSGSKAVSSGNEFAFSLASNTILEKADLTNINGVVLNAETNSKKVLLTSSKLQSPNTSSAHGVNINASGIEDYIINGNFIDVNTYCVLTNAGATVDGLVVLGNILETDQADGVEINNPSRLSQKNITVVGNVIKSTGTPSTPNTGFAVGVAAGKNIAIVGNVADGTYGEAYHIEDDQHTIAIVGNTAINCKQEGVWVGKFTDGAGEGLPIIGNSVRGGVGNLSSGILNVFSVAGSLEGVVAVGNRIVNFKNGIENGKEIAILNANSIDDADIGILSNGRGDIHGINLLKNCPTSVKTTNGSMIGGFITNENPTTILDTSAHPTNGIGTVIREIHFKNPSVSSADDGSGFQYINVGLFPLPDLMKARVICRCKNLTGVDNTYTSVDVKWDGTTLTQTDKISKSQGNFGGTITFSNVGGNFNFNVFSSAAVTAEIKVSIIGEYYKL